MPSPEAVATPLRLGDPDAFSAGVPYAQLAELRRTEPVCWQPMDGEPGFFALLTHADVQAASQDPLLFSSSAGGVMLEDSTPENLAVSRDMLVVMDPPRHGGYRKPVSPSFKRSAVAGLEDQIRSVCRDIMTEARAIGPEVEFVHDVSSKLPARVIGRLMGLPEADWPRIHELSEQMLAGQDPEIVQGDHHESMMAMVGYAMGFAGSRRNAAPQDDLTDLLLTATFDGHLMTDLDFASFFVQLVAAGNDTTKTLTSSGLVALLQHPDQLSAVRGDPSLLHGAVEEMLRWANPIHSMRRTTTADTTLHDVDIPAGSKVALYYTSANRDELVFDDAERFDVRRPRNRHLAFGIGEHFCLGAHLARLEARVFFEELLTSFGSISLAGEPVRLRSNVVNGFRLVPVRLG
ncbi:MAG: cytochrome [Ilumatobacteraceae bacterium]|nr:cytochrome [Ilumatobacteraceae bacterium]